MTIPGWKSAYGRLKRSEIRLEMPSISARSALVEHQLPPGDVREELDRAVVVRRPEPAGGDAELVAEPLVERRVELVRVVADDDQACRLEPEPHELAREERPVAVRALAADELGARQDDAPRAASTDLLQARPGERERDRAVTWQRLA